MLEKIYEEKLVEFRPYEGQELNVGDIVVEEEPFADMVVREFWLVGDCLDDRVFSVEIAGNEVEKQYITEIGNIFDLVSDDIPAVIFSGMIKGK